VFIRADPTMFVVGTLVEVEGRLNANNDLVAKKLRWRMMVGALTRTKYAGRR